jgi:phosphatidate cytidylyltransferase
MALDINTLRTRSITAAIFVVVLVGCIYLSYYSFLALFFFVGIWALKEFYDLAEKLNATPFRASGIISGVITFISIYARQFEPVDHSVLLVFLQNVFFIIPFVIAIEFLFSKLKDPFHAFVFTIAGIFYAIIPFALLVQIPVSGVSEGVVQTAEQYSYFKILGIILLIWANDTFAYLGGSLFGKNKMYEKVSPGKTWEGAVIGVILCIGVGFVLNMDHTFKNNLVWPLIALFVGVFGTIGDLIESLMKRKAGVKDSGNLMPGHGGILDRFDSLLFTSPFLFVILKLVESAN